MIDYTDLSSIARLIIQKAYDTKSGHIGGSLSLAPLLLTLIKDLTYKDQTSYVLSKGHSALGLYSVLHHLKINEEPYDTFCQEKSRFHGHVVKSCDFVKFSTGSLGHGLPMACGLAYDNYAKGIKGRVICFIGDGELQEGTIIETLNFITAFPSIDLKIILDYNGFADSTPFDSDYFFNVRKSLCALFGNRMHQLSIRNRESLHSLQLMASLPGLQFISCQLPKGLGSPITQGDPGRWHAGIPKDQSELSQILESIDYTDFS